MMNFFNFGALEIIFILVIMIIFLGPDQVVKLARNLGVFIRKITQSELWVSIWRTSREIRNLPRTLADETGLQESLNEINTYTKEIITEVDQVRIDLDEEQKLRQLEIRQKVTELNRTNEEMRKRTIAGPSLNEPSTHLEQSESEQKLD